MAQRVGFMRCTGTALRPPELWGERADCSVVAWSIARNITYATAHAMFEAAGRKRKHGTFLPTTAAVHGWDGHWVESHRAGKRGPLGTSDGSGRWLRPTLAQFLREHPRGRYVIHVRRHAFAVVDGVVFDYKLGLRRRIERVWYVVPAPHPECST